MNSYKFPGFSGSTLKLIAVITMFLDHLGASILEKGLLLSPAVLQDGELYAKLQHLDRVLRLIGRPAFPIFCFLLVEGFLHTHDVKRYALRLFGFALISEIPFDLAIRGSLFDRNLQNVYFTLLIGLLVMIFVSKFTSDFMLQSIIYILGLAAGYLLHTDYGFKGVLLIEILYFFRNERISQCVAGAVAFSWESTAPLAFLPIYAYNGKRGLSLKYFFYFFYPVHLLIFGILTKYIIL